MSLKTCSQCKFFQLIENDKNKTGECFRNPPTVFLQTMPVRTAIDPTPKMMTQRSTYYPVVTFDNRECGEFKPYLKEINEI